MIKERTIESGMFLLGFFASSPVVATQSKPTKPKKHLAAPAITPARPNGINPPTPAWDAYSGGMVAGSMLQLPVSPAD